MHSQTSVLGRGAVGSLGLPAAAPGALRAWSAVTVAGVAIFMASLDMTIVNVSLPSLGSIFAQPPSTLEWVVLAYNLPAVALALTAGRWTDRVNMRSAFVVAVLGFAAASLLAGLAPGFVPLLAGRLLQGLFAALILALVPALTIAAVPHDQRGRALGVVTTLGPLGAVSGPVLGSLLLPAFGWPSIFLVNLPIGVAAAVGGYAAIRSGGGLVLPPRSSLVEALWLGSAALAFFSALGRASHPEGADLLSGVLVAISLGALAGWWRSAEARLIRGLLASRQIASALLSMSLLVTTISAVVFLTPFFLHDSLHLDVADLGGTLALYPLGMALTSPLAGLATDRWGGRRLTWMGGLVIALAAASLAPLDPTWAALDVRWRLMLLGVGAGLFVGPNLSQLMLHVEPTRRATLGGLAALTRTLAFALGPALATVAWTVSGQLRAGVLLVAVLSALAVLVMHRVR